MKNMKIYEPAMCCDTGVCGIGVDSELLRVSTILSTLKKNGVVVERFNLSNAPQVFVTNDIVNHYINTKGVDGLPLITLDDRIIISGRYPSNEEFIELLNISSSMISNQQSCQEEVSETGNCCCSGGNCC